MVCKNGEQRDGSVVAVLLFDDNVQTFSLSLSSHPQRFRIERM